MADLCPGPAAAPRRRAGDILSAWVCGDQAKLRQEFAKGLDLCSAPHLLPLEEENLELLKAVVGRLNECPSVWDAEPTDPMVGVCLSLLMHLAVPPDWSESSAGWPADGMDQT
jgi:hypothetical protein